MMMNGHCSKQDSTAQRLEGKVAIITGGASGFGESTARLFVRHGARVVVADVQDALGENLCRGLGKNAAVYVHCDVTCDADVKNLVEVTVAKFGKLDIMFNNAGILGNNKDCSILDGDSQDFKRVFDVNVFGGFLGAKHAAKVMIPAGRGVILFTASVAAITAGVMPHPYTVSKHAVVGLTKNLCVELGQYGIRVNCISPGAIATPFSVKAMGVEKGVVEEIISAAANLKGTVPAADDVAEAALFLASDESRFVSGINLVLDGGYSTTNQSFITTMKQVLY